MNLLMFSESDSETLSIYKSTEKAQKYQQKNEIPQLSGPILLNRTKSKPYFRIKLIPRHNDLAIWQGIQASKIRNCLENDTQAHKRILNKQISRAYITTKFPERLKKCICTSELA